MNKAFHNKLLFNKIIGKYGNYICDGCSHYLKEHRVCGLFPLAAENNVHNFIKHTTYASSSSSSSTSSKESVYCTQYITGYTVPSNDHDYMFNPSSTSDKPGC